MKNSVFLDTAPLIYCLEDAGQLQADATAQIRKWVEADFTLCSSTVTLMELLVKPIRDQNHALAQRYQSTFAHLLSSPPWQLDGAGATLAAQYRARYNLRSLDAMQLACAIVHGCGIFYTNDKDLKRITDIRVVCVGEKV